MKRLIPAAIILLLTVSLCFCSHKSVQKICNNTLKDIEQYHNKTISGQTLKENWKSNKQTLALFANHSFLDKVTIYIDQLVLPENLTKENYNKIYQNIVSILSMTKEEQTLSLHSFY